MECQHVFSITFQYYSNLDLDPVGISLTIPALVSLIFCDSCATTTITIHVEIFTSEDSAVGR